MNCGGRQGGGIVAVRAEVLKEKEGKGGGKERGGTKRFGGRDRVTAGERSM